jgi:hypothetical protein
VTCFSQTGEPLVSVNPLSPTSDTWPVSLIVVSEGSTENDVVVTCRSRVGRAGLQRRRLRDGRTGIALIDHVTTLPGSRLARACASRFAKRYVPACATPMAVLSGIYRLRLIVSERVAQAVHAMYGARTPGENAGRCPLVAYLSNPPLAGSSPAGRIMRSAAAC